MDDAKRAVVRQKLWWWARQRAVKHGVAFTIEPSDIIVPDVCPVLSIELRTNSKVVGKNSPTLDRRDNSLGYIKGNVWVISSLANRMKSSASSKELLLFSDWINKNYASLEKTC